MLNDVFNKREVQHQSTPLSPRNNPLAASIEKYHRNNLDDYPEIYYG